MTTQSPSLGAGLFVRRGSPDRLPTPPKPPTEGLQSRALSGTVSAPGKRRPPVTRFGGVGRPAPNRGPIARLASSDNASDLCHFSVRDIAFPREKTVTPLKTLPWTDKFCQIVRKQNPMMPAPLLFCPQWTTRNDCPRSAKVRKANLAGNIGLSEECSGGKSEVFHIHTQ